MVLEYTSQLYHLDTIGIGTHSGESFTSYLLRLASGHCLSPHELIKSEILPAFDCLFPNRNVCLSDKRLTKNWWQQASVGLDGLNLSTQQWVSSLRELTCGLDLTSLTMVTWSNVLSCRSLIRLQSAWCPMCFQEWADEGQPLYRPLLWSLISVRVCLQHGILLQSRCPFSDCACVQPAISPRAIIGFCARCRRWLGDEMHQVENSVEELELASQRWIVQQIEGLLAVAPRLHTKPAQVSMCQAINAFVEDKLGGNANEFARLIGLHHTSVYALRDGRQIPQLGTLLKLALVMNQSLLELIIGKQEVTLESVSNRPIEIQVPIARPRKVSPKFDRRQVRLALVQILNNQEDPPPSMKKIAKRLGYDQSFLQKHFSKECAELSNRYQKHAEAMKKEGQHKRIELVRQAAQSIHEQGLYPSHYRIRNLVGWALRDPHAREARIEVLKELGYKTD